ncbi:MAG: excinuclease ABC subunit UvrB [Methylococcales bacterium]|nr:excinuclease ABC subunit UvrB [Methylococcales bacterium]MDD5754046.1 excinuclease ABC subunit UvrB [Methylococcales bacterium]
MQFKLNAPYSTSIGQQQAIAQLTTNFSTSQKQTLLGITGSGKTFVMANVIEKLQKPTLIIAHNKTLAAQLFTELKELFPENRVEYFISYYDYYQPESYLPTTDTYIEKDSSVNVAIEKMRLHAVSSLISRHDTIVVASISCIYSLGNPDDFKKMAVPLIKGEKLKRTDLLKSLIAIQYERNDAALDAGKFRVRGDVVDIIPAYESNILRVTLEDNLIQSVKEIDPLTGDLISQIDKTVLYPAKQYVIPEEKKQRAMLTIRAELEARLPDLSPLEAQRLKQRIEYDLEMIAEMGYCSGIENYSRCFENRNAGEPPFTLMDYFGDDYLLIIDESHQTLPQSRAMYNGDFARKKNLVDFGFRLPSAFDNRPLKFDEFESKMRTTLFVSATPADYELAQSQNVVELIIRPTGLLDPEIFVHPISGQMPHLIEQAKLVIERGERVLITTLTKRMAEDLTDYLAKEMLKVRYLHSDVDSLERIELIRQLRAGEYDILVGINLLREGLDIPEVSLVAILDADKEGFLRDERSLIQTIGRAARNSNGKVILFADKITGSMQRAMDITQNRRTAQIAHNEKYGITPQTIVKSVSEKQGNIKGVKHLGKADIERQLIELDAQMRVCAAQLDFEKAIELRDRIAQLRKIQ